MVYLLNVLFCPSSWPMPREQAIGFGNLEAIGDLEKALFGGDWGKKPDYEQLKNG